MIQQHADDPFFCRNRLVLALRDTRGGIERRRKIGDRNELVDQR
jgi:hypothetical protein